MKKLTPTTTHDDNKLIWNSDQGQYELAFEYCKAEFDQNFVDDDTLKKRIKKNSRVVYRFIDSRVNQYNRPLVVAILTRTTEGRKFILDLLTAQFESDVESGYNDITNTSAINVADGRILPREEIKRNEVSVATENVWDNSSAYFGVNLGYQGTFPAYYYLFLGN